MINLWGWLVDAGVYDVDDWVRMLDGARITSGFCSKCEYIRFRHRDFCE